MIHWKILISHMMNYYLNLVKEIADAVQAMTKPKNVPYWTYIVSIGDNKLQH